jgi:hypothetical protein
MIFRTRPHRESEFPDVSASIKAITLRVNESGVIRKPLHRSGSEWCKTDILTGQGTEQGDEAILTGNLCGRSRGVGVMTRTSGRDLRQVAK